MQNYLKLSIYLGLATLLNNALAITPPNGWYAGLLGELSHTSSMNFHLSTTDTNNINAFLQSHGAAPLTSNSASLKYSIGGGGGGQIGYRYCGLRLEGEALFNYSPYKEITVDNFTVSTNQNTTLPFPLSNLTIGGNTSLGAGFFNLAYDFYDPYYDDVSWIPYVGLGIGYGIVQNRLSLKYITSTTNITGTTVSTTTTLADFKKSNKTFVGQAIAGISYAFNENFSLALDYRYIMTQKAMFTQHFRLQTLNLSFNYWFNNPEY